MTREILDALGAAPAAPAGETDSGPSEAPAPTAPPAAGPGQGTDHAPAPSEAPDPAIAAHLGALLARGRELQREFPDFDLSRALGDPAFVRLTAPGMGVDPRNAFLALHPEILRRQAADESRRLLARTLASGAARPREGGGQTGAMAGTDYRQLPRSEQKRLLEQIRKAAARGEKLYP